MSVFGANSKVWRWFAAAAVLLFVALNLGQLNRYGMGLDEGRTAARGRLSIQLAKSVLTGSMAPTEQQINQLRGLKHPPFHAMAFYLASQWGEKWGLDCVASKHYFTVILGGAALAFLYIFIAGVASPRAGFYGVLLMALYPRFIAHSHFGAKDTPILALSILSFHLFNRFLVRRDGISAAVSAIVAGLAIATRLEALFYLPIFAAGLFLDGPWYISRETRKFRKFNLAGVWIVCCALSVFAVWPLLWTNPGHLLDTVAFFSGDFIRGPVIYLDRVYQPTETPWHYTLVHVAAVSPILTLGLAMVGCYFQFRRILFPSERRYFIILSLWFSLPLIARFLPGVSQYDGMRHVYPVIAPVIIFAALGLERLTQWMESLRGNGRGWPAFLAAGSIVLILAVEISGVHPYEGSYFNWAVRLIYPRELDRKFEFSVLHHTTRYGIEWVNENAPHGSRVCVEAGGHVDCLLRPDLVRACDGTAEYDVALPRSRFLNPQYRNREPVFSASRYNSLLVLVYKN